MDRFVRHTALLIIATIIGVAHILTADLLALVFVLPLLIKATSTKMQATSIAGVYILASSHALFFGLAVLSGYLVAFIVWVGLAVVLSLPWLSSRIPCIGIAIAVIAMLLPPLGFLPQVSPLLISGFLFAGMGFSGLLFSLLLLQIIYSIPSKYAISMVVILIIVTPIISDSNSVVAVVAEEIQFNPQSLRAGKQIVIGDCCEADYQTQQIIFEHEIEYSGVGESVYPEATAGILTNTATQRLINISRATNKAFFTGAEERQGKQFNNVLLHVDFDSADIVYRQRLPAPWFLWRGQDAPGFFKAGLLRPATFLYENQIIGALICYEISAPWFVLSTHFDAPKAVIAISNLWWGKETSLPAIMQLEVIAWARLFGVPYYFSINT